MINILAMKESIIHRLLCYGIVFFCRKLIAPTIETEVQQLWTLWISQCNGTMIASPSIVGIATHESYIAHHNFGLCELHLYLLWFWSNNQ